MPPVADFSQFRMWLLDNLNMINELINNKTLKSNPSKLSTLEIPSNSKI